MLVQKSVVKAVHVSELKAGDRLLVDIAGYKDRIIFNQGKVLNNRDVAWLREKIKEPKPKLASERYQTKRKAIAAIRDKAGNVLVKAGDAVTEEALAPLLKEGFTALEGMNAGVMDAGVKVFTRQQMWPDERPWRIDQFNHAVRIETVVTVNDAIQDMPEDQTAGDKKIGVAVGAGAVTVAGPARPAKPA